MSKTPRILIVEDDALIAMALEELLREFGYEAMGPASTIEAAEAALAAETPDVGLFDLNLSGRSTLDLALALKARGAQIVFCTGYETPPGLPSALADAPVLVKPLDGADLGAVLARLLGRD